MVGSQNKLNQVEEILAKYEQDLLKNKQRVNFVSGKSRGAAFAENVYEPWGTACELFFRTKTLDNKYLIRQ